jgi:HAD superfamily hydrolase (TIGR01493 family)
VTGAGVLVDVDGTLVDSNYHHTIAWSRALRDHGCNARLAAIHRLIGMGGSDLLETLIGRSDDAIEKSWRAHFDELLPEVNPFDGAAELLQALHARRLVVVLATSSPTDLLDRFRDKIDADDAVDVLVSADDVADAKPAPDVFETGLSKADLPRDRAMVLGDAIWDVQAAARARLPCVALETGGFSRAELEHEGALSVYRDPTDLLDHLDESPLGLLAEKALARGIANE